MLIRTGKQGKYILLRYKLFLYTFFRSVSCKNTKYGPCKQHIPAPYKFYLAGQVAANAFISDTAKGIVYLEVCTCKQHNNQRQQYTGRSLRVVPPARAQQHYTYYAGE